MRKTIVLLLSVAVILGCIAAPVASAATINTRIVSISTVSEFHGITMKKLKLTFEFKGQGKIRTRLGFKKSGDNTLYGGKTTTTYYNASKWTRTTKYSNLVDSSIGANIPVCQVTIL